MLVESPLAGRDTLHGSSSARHETRGRDRAPVLSLGSPAGYKSPMRRLLLLVVFAVAGSSAVSGCGDSAEDPGAVARAFSRALKADDAEKACVLLAPETRTQLERSSGSSCAAAIGEEDLPDPGAVRRVSVYGTMAQVRFTDDVWFLAEFEPGWRVLASGCTAVPRKPYDCQLQGG